MTADEKRITFLPPCLDMKVPLDDQVTGECFLGSNGAGSIKHTHVRHAEAVDAIIGDHRSLCVHPRERPPSLNGLIAITGKNVLQATHGMVVQQSGLKVVTNTRLC